MNKLLKNNGEVTLIMKIQYISNQFIVNTHESNRTKKNDQLTPISKVAGDPIQYDNYKKTLFVDEFNTTNSKKNENVSYSSLNATNTEEKLQSLNDSLRKKLLKRDQTDIIKEANNIMKERSKNLGKTLLSKPMSKKGYIKDCKEICLKNYLVDLLKDERTDLNDKELMITHSIKSSENKLNFDYKSFLSLMEKEKQGVKTRDQVRRDFN